MENEADSSCRICLKVSQELEPISEYEIEEVPVLEVMRKVLYSLGSNSLIFSQSFDAALPNQLCLDCISVLASVHALNEVCQASESHLKTLIKEELLDFSGNIKVEDEFEATEVEILFEQETEMIKEEDGTEDKRKKPASKRHQCPTCLKLFEKPSKLERHLKTHDVNKKPFACDELGCFQRFLTDASLKRHAILHSGMTLKVQEEKTYECMVCLKEFHVQEALASHIRTHKDIMDKMEFSCNLCDKVFKKLNELTRHRRRHPENKSHQCLICSKMFSQGSHLIDHLNRHNNLRPHVCEVCNKGESDFLNNFRMLSKNSFSFSTIIDTQGPHANSHIRKTFFVFGMRKVI